MGAKEFDITDSVKVICENANDADFITRIVHDIYELGYKHGFDDAEKIALKAMSNITLHQ